MQYRSGSDMDPITGKFSDGNSGTGQPASFDHAADMNQVYDEIINVEIQAGLMPTYGSLQLYAAIQAVLASTNKSANYFIDPCCRISQGLTPNLSTSKQYGAVDLVQAWVSAGTVSAGTIAQDAAGAAGGLTPFSVHLAGVSLGVNSSLSFRRWIESNGAGDFINGPGIVAVSVLQNSGAAIANATLTLNKANAANNFAGGVTNIATSGNLNLPNGVLTRISFPVANMGACGNGIEAILTLPCGAGAIVTKDFYVTDWQFSPTVTLAPFDIPKFNTDYLNVMRYFEKSWDYGTAVGSIGFPGQKTAHNTVATANGSGFNEMDVFYRVPKVSLPTVTVYSEATGATGKIRDNGTGTDIAASLSVQSLGMFEPGNASGSSVVAGDLLRMHWTADARL